MRKRSRVSVQRKRREKRISEEKNPKKKELKKFVFNNFGQNVSLDLYPIPDSQQ